MSRFTKTTKNVSVRIPLTLLSRLEAEKGKCGIRIGTLVNVAIKEFCDRVENQNPPGNSA